MRVLASRLSTFLCRRSLGHVQSCNFSSHNAKAKDELTIEQVMKYSFVVMATVVGYQVFPSQGLGDDYVIQKAVSGLKSKYYKCHGAGILARYATDDKRRMKIVEIGGAQELVNMLQDARDDNKWLAALKALVALSSSDEAVAVLHRAGAISVIKSTPQKWITYPYLYMDIDDPEFNKHKSSLMRDFKIWDMIYHSHTRIVRKQSPNLEETCILTLYMIYRHQIVRKQSPNLEAMCVSLRQIKVSRILFTLIK